jgi:hypothetical protein
MEKELIESLRRARLTIADISRELAELRCRVHSLESGDKQDRRHAGSG